MCGDCLLSRIHARTNSPILFDDSSFIICHISIKFTYTYMHVNYNNMYCIQIKKKKIQIVIVM